MKRLFLLACYCWPAAAFGAEIHVLISGALTSAYREAAPVFERATGHKLVAGFGASMGSSPTSIPSRLERGEPADVVLLSGEALGELIKRGRVVAGSRVDLVRSRIGLAVRQGAPKPDISTVEALRQTLLNAKSISYSSSVSGVYVSTQLFQRLGIADQVMAKSKKTEGMAGDVVARGEAELAFQQISELLPVKGIQIVGPLPAEVQKVSLFSAGVVVGAKEMDAAKALIEFLASPVAAPIMGKHGLEPLP